MMKVALLTALPHTREAIEFARTAPLCDYVRAVLEGHRRTGDEIWSDMQSVLENQANRLFRTCSENRVTVVRDAGRAELSEIAACCDVVIVLAHWKGPLVAAPPPDITASPFEFDGPLRRWFELLRRPINEAEFKRLRDLAPRDARHQISTWLNDDIMRWEEWVLEDLGDACDSVLVSNSWGSNHARSLVDKHFGRELLLPGARLELADGLWEPADLASCFPDGWSGVCDFVCCTSEYLADETKRRHPAAAFRADSRCLEPAVVFAALQELIPRLSCEAGFDDNLVSRYMSIAYDCDRKYGGYTL